MHQGELLQILRTFDNIPAADSLLHRIARAVKRQQWLVQLLNRMGTEELRRKRCDRENGGQLTPFDHPRATEGVSNEHNFVRVGGVQNRTVNRHVQDAVFEIPEWL